MNEFIQYHPVLLKYMLRKKLSSFSFAIIVSVNINDWQNKIGNGYLCSIYTNLEEAKKLETLISTSRGVALIKDIAVEVFVEIYEQEKLKFSVEKEHKAIFDILNYDEISKLTPFLESSTTKIEFEEAEAFLNELSLLSLSKRTLYIFAKSEKHIIQDLKDKIEIFEKLHNLSSEQFSGNNEDLNSYAGDKFQKLKKYNKEMLIHEKRFEMLGKYLSNFGVFVV